MSQSDKARSRLAEVRDRLATLDKTDEWTEDLTKEATDLAAEGRELVKTIDAAEERAAFRAQTERYLQSGNVSSGANVRETLESDPVGEPSSVGALNRGGADPFDIATIDRTMDPETKYAEFRARAADAVTRMDGMNDARRKALQEKLDKDPSGKIAEWVLVHGSPAYGRAFNALLRGKPWKEDERRAVERAMTLTTTQGGFAVPTFMDPTLIITGAGSTNPFRQVARSESITTNVWRGLSAGQITASFDAENAAVSDDAATYAQPSITAHMARVFVPGSIEIFMDSPNITAEISALILDSKDNLEASAFATGTGTGEPWGVVAAVSQTAGSRVAAANDASIDIDDLFDVYDALPARYEGGNLTWVMHKAMLSNYRQVGGTNFYERWLTLDQTSRRQQLLGDPVITSSAMDATLTTSTNDDTVLYGDFRHYVIADRVGLNLENVQHLFSTATGLPTGTRGVFAFWRVGADSIVDNAFRLLRHGGGA